MLMAGSTLVVPSTVTVGRVTPLARLGGRTCHCAELHIPVSAVACLSVLRRLDQQIRPVCPGHVELSRSPDRPFRSCSGANCTPSCAVCRHFHTGRLPRCHIRMAVAGGPGIAQSCDGAPLTITPRLDLARPHGDDRRAPAVHGAGGPPRRPRRARPGRATLPGVRSRVLWPPGTPEVRIRSRVKKASPAGRHTRPVDDEGAGRTIADIQSRRAPCTWASAADGCPGAWPIRTVPGHLFSFHRLVRSPKSEKGEAPTDRLRPLSVVDVLPCFSATASIGVRQDSRGIPWYGAGSCRTLSRSRYCSARHVANILPEVCSHCVWRAVCPRTSLKKLAKERS